MLEKMVENMRNLFGADGDLNQSAYAAIRNDIPAKCPRAIVGMHPRMKGLEIGLARDHKTSLASRINVRCVRNVRKSEVCKGCGLNGKGITISMQNNPN